MRARERWAALEQAAQQLLALCAKGMDVDKALHELTGQVRANDPARPPARSATPPLPTVAGDPGLRQLHRLDLEAGQVIAAVANMHRIAEWATVPVPAHEPDPWVPCRTHWLVTGRRTPAHEGDQCAFCHAWERDNGRRPTRPELDRWDRGRLRTPADASPPEQATP